MEIKTVSLIGLGAMGVYFAPRLQAQLGDRFRVIAGGARKARLETQGVTINGVNYHFPITAPEEQTGPADLVLMAVKDGGLDQAIADIRNQVGENTQILCVMNGVESETRVATVYGWEHVLYSYMRVSIVMKDGVANYDPALGKIHFGEADNRGEPSARVAAIQALFDRCGIPYENDPDMVRGLWFKYMCNVGENMTCALLAIPFGAFRWCEPANELRRAAMREVTVIAQAKGIDLGEADIQRQEATVKALPPENKPSTLQDLEAGRKTEVEMFAGAVVRMGRELGIDTPVCWVLYQGIRTLEEKQDHE